MKTRNTGDSAVNHTGYGLNRTDYGLKPHGLRKRIGKYVKLIFQSTSSAWLLHYLYPIKGDDCNKETQMILIKFVSLETPVFVCYSASPVNLLSDSTSLSVLPPVLSPFTHLKPEASRGQFGSLRVIQRHLSCLPKVNHPSYSREIVRFSRISPTVTSEPSYFPSRDHYLRLLLSIPISYIYDNRIL